MRQSRSACPTLRLYGSSNTSTIFASLHTFPSAAFATSVSVSTAPGYPVGLLLSSRVNPVSQHQESGFDVAESEFLALRNSCYHSGSLRMQRSSRSREETEETTIASSSNDGAAAGVSLGFYPSSLSGIGSRV